jgi:hypothetical protein
MSDSPINAVFVRRDLNEPNRDALIDENVRLSPRPHQRYSYPSVAREVPTMCRNIKMLFNFNPPVTPAEIQAASLQFVRKISGFNKPSKANEEAFAAAVNAIAHVSANLLNSLETNAPAKSRDQETARLKARSAKRFGDARSPA